MIFKHLAFYTTRDLKMQSFITLLNKVETLRTLFFVVLFTLSTTTFAQDPIQSITEASAEINETLGELSTVVESFVNQGNPNTQVLEFKPIVDRLEAFLKSTYFEEIIKNNVTYYHYNKLMQNHLLHINLQNEISASKELHKMYPHELPFHHDGRFPAKPTLEALDKIKVFLEVLSSDINDQSTETIFLEPRIEQAIDFIKQVYAHMKQHEKSNETLKILNDESLQKNPNETTQAYFGRLKNKLRSKPNSLKIILSQKIKSLKEKELHTLKSLTSKPMETYLLFKKRIEQDGINASFPEYGDVVRQMVLWLKTSGNVENAIKNQPSLNLMRLDALKHLELSLQRNIPYRQTLDALMRASEFLDITERTLHPEKALHSFDHKSFDL